MHLACRLPVRDLGLRGHHQALQSLHSCRKPFQLQPVSYRSSAVTSKRFRNDDYNQQGFNQRRCAQEIELHRDGDRSLEALLLLALGAGLVALQTLSSETEAAEKPDVFVEPSTGHQYPWRLQLGDGPQLSVLGGGIRVVLRYFTTYSFVFAADLNQSIREQLSQFASLAAPTKADEDAFLRKLFSVENHRADTAIHIIGYREANGPHMVSGFNAKLEPLLPKDPTVQQLYKDFCKMLPGVKKGGSLSFVWRTDGSLEIIENGKRAGVLLAANPFATHLFAYYFGPPYVASPSARTDLLQAVRQKRWEKH